MPERLNKPPSNYLSGARKATRQKSSRPSKKEEERKREEKAAKESAKKAGKKSGSPGGQVESGVQQKKDSEWIGYTYKNFEVVGDEVKKKTSSRPSMSSVFRSP